MILEDCVAWRTVMFHDVLDTFTKLAAGPSAPAEEQLTLINVALNLLADDDHGPLLKVFQANLQAPSWGIPTGITDSVHQKVHETKGWSVEASVVTGLWRVLDKVHHGVVSPLLQLHFYLLLSQAGYRVGWGTTSTVCYAFRQVADIAHTLTQRIEERVLPLSDLNRSRTTGSDGSTSQAQPSSLPLVSIREKLSFEPDVVFSYRTASTGPADSNVLAI